RLQSGKEAGDERRFGSARQGVAEPRRSAVLRRLDPARHRTRRDSRRAAWGRRTAGVVRGLYAGEESRPAPAPIRLWRHQGRPRAGIRQQCGRADVVHPDADLGIPGNPTMAMMIGALMIHGIAPGPRVMTDRPGLFWGLIASMWLGNLMLVILNLPMVGVW